VSRHVRLALEHEHAQAGAPRQELAGGGEADDAGTDDRDVVAPAHAP